MPHSSGGGSHSSGSHSSSGRSSSSYSRSYSGGSSSSSSSAGWEPGRYKISRTSFAGSNRRVYYDRFGHYHNLYRAGTGKGLGTGEYWIDMIVYSLIAFGIAAFLMWVGTFHPEKIDLNTYDSRIEIKDETGLINETVLRPSLTNFQKTTGVTPVIEVIYDSSWKGQYSDLETYSYFSYVDHYTDEKHWLIVISYPDNYADLTFIDWSWEGMIGDDCVTVINSNSEETFTQNMQSCLNSSTPASLSRAIAEAFDKTSETVMNTQRYKSMWAIAYVVLIAWGCMGYYLTSTYITDSQYKKAIPVADNAAEMSCVNCGNVYIVGTVKVCPRCGNSVTKEK